MSPVGLCGVFSPIPRKGVSTLECSSAEINIVLTQRARFKGTETRQPQSCGWNYCNVPGTQDLGPSLSPKGASFESQRHHGIDFGGMACGNITREEDKG